MSYVREALVRARELIALGWTQGTYAEDEDGAEISFADPQAVCFCLAGAVKAATGTPPHDKIAAVFQALADGIGGMALIAWNDAELRTQDEVLALFDAAIANA